MKKIYLKLLVIMIIMLSLVACTNNNELQDAEKESQVGINDSVYQKISPKDAKEILDENDSIVLLDVRTKEEYDEGHIPNSILLPVDDIRKEAENVITDKDTIIFVYCRSGRRSKNAALELIDLGYTKVYDLGGIIDWPYEVEK
ncbi:rhodanese-like domain-containing protein [Abyssisolibacter fermentans]|uniref:rhodanese-like domain-containing protein n=1 Tax=Abyssisolibacter fermentans TaxID=1766203 RepID=UPI00083730EE|nr:rhodanese-like domain-containing protein [Abyssisolibacter fermentans]